MPRIPNLKLTIDDVSQEIDLKEYLGIDVSNNGPMKDAIGQWMIDRILERTSKGTDAYGKSFKKYSKEYVASEEFMAFKNTKTVNMDLRGDMLASIDILSAKGNKIKIGLKDKEQIVKAFGHMTGMEGNKNLEGIAPVRTFFGLSDKDLDAMKKEFTPDLTKASDREKSQDQVLSKLANKADNLDGGADGSQDQGN